MTLPWRSLMHGDSPGTAGMVSRFFCHLRSHEKLLKGMERIYTIGQVAQVAGVPTSTLRYYERIGLLQAAGRIAGNYRRYGMEALEQLRFIRAAQATGFSLEDVTALLQLRDAPASACQDVQVRTTCRPDWRRRKPPRFTKLVLKNDICIVPDYTRGDELLEAIGTRLFGASTGA